MPPKGQLKKSMDQQDQSEEGSQHVLFLVSTENKIRIPLIFAFHTSANASSTFFFNIPASYNVIPVTSFPPHTSGCCMEIRLKLQQQKYWKCPENVLYLLLLWKHFNARSEYIVMVYCCLTALWTCNRLIFPPILLV